MFWQGANVESRKHRKAEEVKERGETVEAALNRLSKQYAIAMDCVAAWHKADAAINAKTPSSRKDVETLLRVGRAARTTFEQTILSDPLIAKDYAPATAKALAAPQQRPAPVQLTSAGHKATVKLTAYLSLVNYADLLLAGTPVRTSDDQERGILDRGLVRVLRSLTNAPCWMLPTEAGETEKDGDSDESKMELEGVDESNMDVSREIPQPEEVSVRLALVSYMDATALDGSDPTVWLKLACAARRLGRILQRKNDQDGERSTAPALLLKYRRLEKHALERAVTALPTHEPPNRLAVKALQEWWHEEQARDLQYYSPPGPIAEPETVTIQLPRYSWSTLGRILVRACKEGSSASNPHSPTSVVAVSNRFHGPVSSPVTMKLSPMLILPSSVLAEVCQFLETSEIWRIEATCKSMSASIISARALLDANSRKIGAAAEAKEQHSGAGRTNKVSSIRLEPEKREERQVDTSTEDLTTEQNDTQQFVSESRAEEASLPESEATKPSRTFGRGDDTIDRSNCRASKRLRSQIITSGKREERSRRRSSVEYCLLAATLGCSANDNCFRALLKEGGDQKLESDSIHEVHSRRASMISHRTKDSRARDKTEAMECLSGSSLYTFVEQWSSRNAPALSVLFGFVAHTSLHIHDVFASDLGGAVLLTSCLLESFALMVRRTKLTEELVASWALNERRVPREAHLSPLELFAIDLLHAELRLKRAADQEQLTFDFDGDGNFVCTMVPNLLTLLEKLETTAKDHKNKDLWFHLKARCYWLAATFFLWRGQLSSQVSESREAESEGLRYINETINFFQTIVTSPLLRIQTPHLMSPKRRGQHWKEISLAALSVFRAELQASSVVLLAEEQFLQATSKFQRMDEDQLLNEEDRNAFFSIGESLLTRYKADSDSPDAKYSELIDDFLSVHGDKLSSRSFTQWSSEDDDSDRTEFHELLPHDRVDTVNALLRLKHPCILAILVSCLQTKDGMCHSITQLFVQLVLTMTNLFDAFPPYSVDHSTDEEGGEFTDVSDSEDENSISSDEFQEGRTRRNANREKLEQYAVMMQLLLEKIYLVFVNQMTDDERLAFAESCASLLRCSLKFVAEWFRRAGPAPMLESSSRSEDLGVFLATQTLFRSVVASPSSEASRRILTREYVVGLMRIVVAQHHILLAFSRSKPMSRGRSERLKTTRRRADLVASVCCEAGMLFSQNLFRVVGDNAKRSFLFCRPNSCEPATAQLAEFINSLLWLWKVASSADAGNPSINRVSAGFGHLGSYVDKFGRERLRIPIAAAIIGLCGSAATTDRLRVSNQDSGNAESSGDQIGLTEFVDSDASAADWSQEDDDETWEERKRRMELLRVISQAVHCIDNVFGKIDENEVVDFLHVKGYVTNSGPILPLVVSRVLNALANHLIVVFAEEEQSQPLRSDYPFGTRTIGLLLDSMLHRVYRYLHGFTLTHSSENKEASQPTSGTSRRQDYAPESVEAAAMLYRCILRAYSQGRKSPPKSALDTVLRALPEVQESEQSKAIRKYLFAADRQPSGKYIVNLLRQQSNWEATFSSMGLVDARKDMARAHVEDEDEAVAVRRGVSHLLAQGPLPQYQESGDENDIRESSALAEDELSRKFLAIVDDLCFGRTDDCEGWHKASQCLIDKADLIADRLGLSEGFARNKSFYIKERLGLPLACMDIVQLVSAQDRETTLKEEGWLRSLGTDLSLFVRYSWSSFNSLKTCSTEVGKTLKALLENDSGANDDEDVVFVARVWKEINDLYHKEDFVGWQQAWGGLFVSSLRSMACRCLCLALYVLYKSDSSERDNLLLSDTTELLATLLYSDLMGSQMYGFPLHTMTSYRKREAAECSLACFERTLEVITEHETGRFTWDLVFMTGKCHEKIASTYQREAFPNSLDDRNQKQPTAIRRYEHHMAKALKAYAASIVEEKEAEEGGQYVPDANGGSGHGSAEAIYRLHASRLKCLIAAVDREEDEREQAEHEALRLTECHWFSDPEGGEDGLSVRDRVWRVLVDVVAALARCRLDHTYFHRSVYRHAQALMWSPVLYDPVGERANGSLGTVSATWAFKIRGLNYATNAASSADVVISSLFEKKRSQLCAVWVTSNGSANVFQTINSSVRKFDSLRGKYISAYLESLRLCGRKKEIETFLRWTSSCTRDLPSYFAASALAAGGRPRHPHTHDSLLVRSRSLSSYHLLTNVKRQANSALAGVIVKELKKAFADKKLDTKQAENQLKLAYACFLRLNCEPSDLMKTRAWKYQRSNGVKDVVDALTAAFLAVSSDQGLSGERSDWSGESQLSGLLESALKKCKELFPSLSGNFFSIKRSPMKRRKSGQGGGKSTDSDSKVSFEFEVAVPTGLAEGDSFVTSIQVRETVKQVRLTVPHGAPENLRFILQIPADEASDRPNKQRRREEESSP